MAPPPEPEVQFAQRLASNEKPLRTRAIKKLRKYINVRSQRAQGGFTSDELLKLWKGLFYCLWMQDKPLLQEELSNQISGLLHNFQSVDGQFLYLEAFLQTVKREWTGIDRLRMDKFYQLTRFMFRQTLEMLKKKDWDSGVVSRFLETLTSHLLHSTSSAPIGLQLHVLDLYLTELTAVGAAELTAEQNLKFIEPFCKTAAKTKDQVLFKAMCRSIFCAIIDQAPFAIEDLMREVGGEGDSDSAQASDEEEEMKSHPAGKIMKNKGSGKQLNGSKSKGDEDDESDTELPDDEGAGPVLQFDYTAVADKLLELASRGNTPSRSRQRLYKIIKVMRDLSEGIFPQDEYPEEVSTDEDDDEMFGSRKRLRKQHPPREWEEEEDDGAPVAKKMKGKKAKESRPGQKNKDSAKDGDAQDNSISDGGKKKKKRRKKKKVAEGKHAAVAAETQEGSACADGETPEPVASSDGAEGPGAPTPPPGEDRAAGEPRETPSKKKRRKRNKSGASPAVATPAVAVAAPGELQPPPAQNGDPSAGSAEPKTPPGVDADVELPPKEPTTKTQNQPSPLGGDSAKTTPLTKKARKKGAKGGETPETGSQVEEESCGAPAGDTETSVLESEVAPEAPATPARRKKKGPKAEIQVEEAGGGEVEGVAAAQDSKTPKNKNKKNLQQVKSAQEEETEYKMATATPLKRKTKKCCGTTQAADVETPLSQIAVDTPTQQQQNNNKDQQAAVNPEPGVKGQAEDDAPAEGQAPPSSQKKGKKRKIPVVFEFEADEVEAAKVNGHAEEGEKKKRNKMVMMGNGVEASSTPLKSLKKTPVKKKQQQLEEEEPFISFQSHSSVPTPLFFKARGNPRTPLTGRKRPQTPMSESKKVTFGLKNNKTAEFKKTDRSLLVSPEGSSRVPFDPEQKPKFGVLKTPPGAKKTPKAKKNPGKTPSRTAGPAVVTPRRRPAAADFF